VDVLHTADTTKENVFRSVVLTGRDNTGAINEVNSLHQCDILPHLGLTRNGSDCADLLVTKGVDDGGLARVGVSNQTNRNLLTVGVERRELTEQSDQGSLAERVVDVGVESQCRVVLGKMTNPGSLVKMKC
jgi:hypothetical protein